MKRILIGLLAVLALLSFNACSDDDDDNNTDLVSKVTKDAFSEKYPTALKVKWEGKTTPQGTYMVAKFEQNGRDVDVWYDNNGQWYMTETEMPFAELPEAVKKGFQASEYVTWKVDSNEVDKLERNGLETLYVIEVEQGKDEVDLYFSEDGVLVYEVPDGDNGHTGMLPSVENLPAKVKTYLDGQFSNYRIIDVELDTKPQGTFLEVEIIHDNKKKEVNFDATSNDWVWTEWELRPTGIPQVVKAGIDKSEYATWSIDDVDYIEHVSDGIYYLIEFEKKGQADAKVRFDAQGQIIK